MENQSNFERKKDKIGVIHGRFQGLHLGHMEFLLEGMRRCEHLYIGITNFDTTSEKPNTANSHRLTKQANPFTFYDRLVMIRNSMIEAGISTDRFDIIPFPIENPEKIYCYAPADATYYLTIYDKWGEQKLNILKNLGLKTEVMWIRTDDTRITSGTEVRKLIKENKEWKHLVPGAVYEYVTNKLQQKDLTR